MSGLEGVDQYPGHLAAQISLHLIFSCGDALIFRRLMSTIVVVPHR